MMEEIKIAVSLDENAYMPYKAHEDDAGFDLRAIKGDYIPGFANGECGAAVFDTGVHMNIPSGYCGLLVSKSGLNVNKGITSTGLIDAGYTGSIKVKLYNHTNSGYIVEDGDKISQIVILPVANVKLCGGEMPEDTDRGDGGFGSSGR